MKKWGRIFNDSAADPPAVRRAGYPLRPVSPTLRGVVPYGTESGWKADSLSFIALKPIFVHLWLNNYKNNDTI
ncbi:MAG: hypothetical protein JRI26_10690 [Deltaproteobacteria bacterium]|nr:hypothetical protein [Deltaproteobacteria bacterium]